MSQCELLNKISELQFVCVELDLYLCTNPGDAAAKHDYLCYGEMLKQLIGEYEALYGPLMNFGHSPVDTGCYVMSAWPWD